MREFEAKPPLRVRVRNNYNRVHSQIDPTNSLLTPELLSKNSMETNFWLSSALGYRGVGCPQGGGVMLDLLPHERRREVGSSSILYPTQELMQGHNQVGRVIRDLLPQTHVPSFAEEGGAVVVSTHVGGKRVPGHLVWWSTALRGSYYYTTRRRAAGCFGQIWRNPTPIVGSLAGL